MEQRIQVDKLNRNIEGLKLSASGLGLGLSSDTLGSFSLDAAGGADDQAIITATLSHTKDLFLFGLPCFSLYVDSIDTANVVYGSTYDHKDFEMWQWLDQGATDNKNVVLHLFVRNLTVSSQDLIVVGNWRFLLEEVE